MLYSRKSSRSEGIQKNTSDSRPYVTTEYFYKIKADNKSIREAVWLN
jgi:hypothetical protein